MTQSADEKLEILFDDHVYFLTVNIAAPIDLALNLFGMFVIAAYSSSEMSAYKWYLFNLQFWSTAFDASMNVLQLEIWFPLSAGTAEHGLNRYIGLPGHAIFVLQYTLCFLSATALVCCGMHRYNAALDICSTTARRGLSQSKLFLICLALHVFIGVSFAVILGLCYIDNTTLQDYFKQHYPYLVSKVSTVQLIGSFMEVNIMICVFYVWALVSVMVMTCIWLVCAFSTLRILRELKKSLAPSTLEFHRWLLLTHIVQVKSFFNGNESQTVIPFLFIAPPMATTMILFFGRFNHTGRFGNTMFCVHGMHGMANTLIVLTMIRGYRDYVLEHLGRIFGCSSARRNAVRDTPTIASTH